MNFKKTIFILFLAFCLIATPVTAHYGSNHNYSDSVHDILQGTIDELMQQGYSVMPFICECAGCSEYEYLAAFNICMRCGDSIRIQRSMHCVFFSGGGYCISIIVVQHIFCRCNTETTSWNLPGCGAWHQ